LSSSTLTLPQREQHRRPSTAAADATSPTAPRSPWARTRHDLVIWLVLSDLFAVAVPFWLALLGGPLPLVGSATTVGISMVLIAWFLGALGIDAVEQALLETLTALTHDVAASLSRIHPATTSAWGGPDEHGVWTLDLSASLPFHP